MVPCFNPPFIPAVARRALLTLCLGVLATAVCAAPKKDKAEVLANAELTKEGRKASRPTPGHPVYYVPVIHGWHESGKIIAGEEPPKRADVLRHLAQALAKEGYILQALRPDANITVPSIIIHIAWGYMNPDVVESGALDLSTSGGGSLAPAGLRNDPTQSTASDFNAQDMLTLVAGSMVGREATFSQADWDRLGAAVGEGRYFIILSAYDFAASVKGEQKLLWCTRVSTARQGVWMSDVVPALVATSTSLFGRQTEVPIWKSYPVREGHVDLGELKVLDRDVKTTPGKKP